MRKNLADYWWLVVLRGVFAILFGLVAFVWPSLTVGALVIMFGAYVLIDGVSLLISAFKRRDTNDRWWLLALEGLAGVVAGILTFVWPGVTAIVLLYFIAAWAIITGVLEIVTAVRLREEIEGEWLMGLMGLASIILGIMLLINPGAGAIGLVWAIASYAILFGILLIYLGLKLRGWREDGQPATA